MSEELLVDVDEFEIRVALMRDGEPLEVIVDEPAAGGTGIAGNIYLGKIVRVAPAVGAVFVDIGIGRPGVLFSGEGPEPLRNGARILVQVGKDQIGGRDGGNGKAPKLTMHPSLAGRYVVVRPLDTRFGISTRIDDDSERQRLATLVGDIQAARKLDWGCVVRTAAAGATGAQLDQDFEHLHKTWQQIHERCRRSQVVPALVFEETPMPMRAIRDLAGPALTAVIVDDDAAHARIVAYAAAHMPGYGDKIVRHQGGGRSLFDAYGLEAAIEGLLDRRVPLPSGGCLVIEHTEAMTSIDVNSGSQMDAANPAATAVKTNLEAAAAIPRQLRLRNIGGIVVVDFIGMASAEHRDDVRIALGEAAEGDPGRLRASGFSPLGLVEISRRRTRDSLLGRMTDACPTCGGQGHIKAPQRTCHDVLRTLQRRAPIDGDRVAGYVVHAAEVVVDRLLGEDADHLASVSQRTGRPVQLQAQPRYRPDEFDVVGTPPAPHGPPAR